MIRQAAPNLIQEAAHRWTGHDEFPLIDEEGFEIGSISIMVRMDTVELHFQDKCAGVLDRERLRDWLTHPAASILATDDVAWSVEHGVTCLTIGMELGKSGMFYLSRRSTQSLQAVI